MTLQDLLFLLQSHEQVTYVNTKWSLYSLEGLTYRMDYFVYLFLLLLQVAYIVVIVHL